MDLRVKPKAVLEWRPPERSLRALAEHAPRAEAFVETRLERVRPQLTWLYGVRRRIATAGVGLLTVWLFLHVTFGANGMVVYRQKKAEYQDLETQINHLQTENDRYASQIKALETDPKAIEKEAREQLHYARPGEVVYVAPPPAPAQASGVAAASK